jgi:hypothetical protein
MLIFAAFVLKDMPVFGGRIHPSKYENQQVTHSRP